MSEAPRLKPPTLSEAVTSEVPSNPHLRPPRLRPLCLEGLIYPFTLRSQPGMAEDATGTTVAALTARSPLSGQWAPAQRGDTHYLNLRDSKLEELSERSSWKRPS